MSKEHEKSGDPTMRDSLLRKRSTGLPEGIVPADKTGIQQRRPLTLSRRFPPKEDIEQKIRVGSDQARDALDQSMASLLQEITARDR